MSNPIAQVSLSKAICCRNCLIVVVDAGIGQQFCPECAAERERIRKLKWTYKRQQTPARIKRYRPKKKKAAA